MKGFVKEIIQYIILISASYFLFCQVYVGNAVYPLWLTLFYFFLIVDRML